MRIDSIVYKDFGNWASRMFVITDENGEVTLFLNARFTREQLLEHLPHEIGHLLMGHFSDERSVRELEREAEEYRRRA